MEILFEDNHLLVVNKPAGLLTEPSGTLQDSVYAQTKQYLKEKYQKPGNVFLGIVHRLDKPASGIVLFAKTSKALSRLNEAMRGKKYKKVYAAIVENKLPQETSILEHYLVHDDYKASLSSKEKGGKQCKLSYKLLKKKGNFSLVDVLLETGRYHQIRAQFALIGCPLLGDYKYGSKEFFMEEAIALHHRELEFTHPVTGKVIQVQAALPPRFEELMQ